MITRRILLQTSTLLLTQMGISRARAAQGTGKSPLVYERIAVEETFSIPEIMEATLDLAKSGAKDEPGLVGFWRGRDFDASPPPWLAPLYDLGDMRLKAMDDHGISKQLLSLSSPGVQVFGPEQGGEFAALANDRLAEAIRKHPDRFAGLAAIAPQAPEEAARELERGVKNLGLKGAIINSHTKGEYLDDPKFRPIFEAAQALGVPIYLHPRTPSPQMVGPYLDYGLLGAMWGFEAETGLHALRMILGGVFDLFPDLHIVLGHMGESIPLYLERIDKIFGVMRRSDKDLARLKRRPGEYFMDNFSITTSGMNWRPALLMAHAALGPDRILFAVDYPYGDNASAVEVMDSMPLSLTDREKIYHLNAKRVFSL